MINQDVIYALKAVAFVFLAMNVVSVCVTLSDKKDNRLPWKKVFETTARTFVAVMVAAIVVSGLAFLMLKP